MTVWDKIYQNYQKTGEGWGTLGGRVLPNFIEFLKNTKFDKKRALEIGCGDGKYLMILKDLGFKTDGIDSSPTAVKMAKKNLGDDSKIVLADMFEYEIPRDRYDLIFSIFAAHHGLKEQVEKIVDKIYKALPAGGKVFATVPDFESSKQWESFKDKEDLGNGTYAPLSGPEKGLPHSFYTPEETKEVFKKFKNVKVEFENGGNIVAGNLIISGEK